MASFLSTPLIRAEYAIAADANFLSWCGASDAQDAKDNFIFSDDSREEVDLPPNYAAITEMQGWAFIRNADGAGRASFLFSSGQFTVVFVQDVGGKVSDYTKENRIAFKDKIAGFISEFIANYEATGSRLASVSEVPESETFPFRASTGEGRYVYQYGIVCEIES